MRFFQSRLRLLTHDLLVFISEWLKLISKQLLHVFAEIQYNKQYFASQYYTGPLFIYLLLKSYSKYMIDREDRQMKIKTQT